MTWIKLDDGAPRHPKIAGLSDRAFRAWIRALCYSSEFLTDGSLPVPFLVTVPRKIQDELMDAGLWSVASTGAISIHDYLEHQRAKASIRKQRDKGKDRQQRFRNADSNAPRNGVTNADVTQPEESRGETDSPFNSPADAGAVRVRREHRNQAKQILKAQMGYCRHQEPCVNQQACEARIASEIARKAS